MNAQASRRCYILPSCFPLTIFVLYFILCTHSFTYVLRIQVCPLSLLRITPEPGNQTASIALLRELPLISLLATSPLTFRPQLSNSSITSYNLHISMLRNIAIALAALFAALCSASNSTPPFQITNTKIHKVAGGNVTLEFTVHDPAPLGKATQGCSASWKTGSRGFPQGPYVSFFHDEPTMQRY